MLFTAAFVLAIMTIVKRTMLSGRHSLWRNGVLFIILPGLCAGAAACNVRSLLRATAFEITEPQGNYFVATVTDAKMSRYSQEAVLAIDETNSPFRRRILAYLPVNTELSSNEIIQFTRKPRFIRKDGVKGNFAIGLLRKGMCGTVTLSHGEFVIEGTGASKIRMAFRKEVARHVDVIFSRSTASLLKGLYFGNKNHIDKETVQDFTWAGVLHVLAASGMHLATLVFLPLALFSFFTVDRRPSFPVIAAIVALYLFLTDMPVSLVRAFAMFVFGGMHIMIDADRKPLNILFHAASWILIFSPWELYQLGFQLTFGATAGILLFYKNCRETFNFLPKIFSVPLALTVSAQSLVYPVLALQLGEINLTSVISNLVIVPLVQMVFAGSLLVVAFDAILPFSIAFAALPIEWLYALAKNFAKIFATLPGHFAPENISPLLAIPLILFMIPCVPGNKCRFIKAAALPIALIGAWLLLYEPVINNNSVILGTAEKTNAVITLNGSEAVISGEISSMSDAREIVRVIKNHRARSVAMSLHKIDYTCAPAVLHVAKNVRIVSFEVPENVAIGRYLEKLFEVLERDEVKIVGHSKAN